MKPASINQDWSVGERPQTGLHQEYGAEVRNVVESLEAEGLL
jgi:hypothetical protein